MAVTVLASQIMVEAAGVVRLLLVEMELLQ